MYEALDTTLDRRVALKVLPTEAMADPTDTGTLYNVACLYSLEGRKGEAMGYLEKAIENDFAQKAWIENGNDLAALRDMPRYKALLQKMK